MFVVIFKQHGALNCEQQVFGPFADYLDAEDALSDGSIPLLYGQGGAPWPADDRPPCPGDGPIQRPTNGHRYIQPLEACKGTVR